MTGRSWGALAAVGAIVLLAVGLGVWMDGGFDLEAAREMPLLWAAGGVVMLVVLGVAIGLWSARK